MDRIWLQLVLVLMTGLMLFTQGCETAGSIRQPQWVSLPISSVKDVAGKWEGLMTRLPHTTHGLDDDWVRVSITEDGTFHFVSYRTIGVFSGGGRLVPDDSKLVAKSERGQVTFTLYVSRDERRMLKATGTTKDGLVYSAELSPAQ